MDSDKDWITISKNKQTCNIRSCYNCNKNFSNQRFNDQRKKRHRASGAGKSERFMNSRISYRTEKFCRNICNFCSVILQRISRAKESQDKEFYEKGSEKDLISDEKKDEILEDSKEEILEHEKHFSKERKRYSILDRVRIVGMAKKL